MSFDRLRLIVLLKTVAAITAMVFSVISTAQDTRVHQVEIYQFKFVPATLHIKPGDTVVWTNRDIVPHTATASNDSWGSGEVLTGQSRSASFNKDTVLSYYCRFHPTMKATLQILTDVSQ
jgi:plastocyanin